MCYLYGHPLRVGKSSKILEMGYTPAEFVKTLQGQFTARTPYQIKSLANDHWEIELDDHHQAKVFITAKAGMSRKIAMLSLPVLHVTFDFKNISEKEQADFFKTFFRYFHKGGG